MKQIYHFSDQLGSVDCIPCPEKNPSGLAEPVEQDFLTTVHLESLGRQVSVGILTGSTRRSARQELSKMADAGNLDILVGTQPLIQSGVFVPNLALVVSHVRNRRDRAGGVSFWRPEC